MVAAALFGVACVPLHDVRRADVKINDNVLVIGAGLIGQFAAQAASAHGARVTIMDIDNERLNMAETLGINERINSVTKEGGEKLQKDKPFSVIIEGSGADILDQAVGTKWGGGSGLSVTGHELY